MITGFLGRVHMLASATFDAVVHKKRKQIYFLLYYLYLGLFRALFSNFSLHPSSVSSSLLKKQQLWFGKFGGILTKVKMIQT